MTVTAVGCMPETTAITRRDFRGYEEFATTEASTTPGHVLLHPKRQTSTNPPNATNPISGSGQSPQAQVYLTQLNTAIFIIDLINTKSNLNQDCQDLRAGNATLAAAVAINETQAADFVCAAYAANLTSIDPTLLQIFAAALYAVEIAGNFTGTTNTTTLCSSVDVDILTLPIFGVDGQGVQTYVCSAFNATLTTTFTTVTSGTAVSAGTITPTVWGNQTSFGTAPLVTGPVGTDTGASAGGSGSTWPFGNFTGIRTGSFTGPRTNSGSGPQQSTVSVPGSLPFSASGTNAAGPPYSNFTAFPTGYGSGYAQPTGTGPSGWPNGNLTSLPTWSGSGYAQSTGTAGSDDPVGTQFSSYELPSSARLPPNPSTLHFYPAVSPSTSPVVFHGYGYDYQD